MILDSLVHELLSRWEAAPADSKPSADELCAAHPELLPKVRDCIARLCSVDQAIGLTSTTNTAPPLIPGFEIQGELGRGGMGIVWKALQTATNRVVALKTIAAGEFATPRARARFEREVGLAAKLNHPNIARVYESGSAGPLVYYAMELVEGVPLDQFARQHDLPRRKIVELMIQVCAAVQHAHQFGVIHRDLKPSNILVNPKGVPHLLDFGLAKELWSDDSRILTMDVPPGTPAYMSPEQVSGEVSAASTASDVYSLGVILYYLLLRTFPYDVNGNALQIMQRVREATQVPPRSIDRHFPRDLSAIVMKCLSRDLQHRYQSTDSLASDLERWLAGRPIPGLQLGIIYTVRKVAARHKYKLILASSILGVILTTAIVAYVNVSRARDRAETNAQIASAVNTFLKEMLASADPTGAGGPVPTLPQLLERASKRIDTAFRDQPLVEASLRSTISDTYVQLGTMNEAEPHARRALSLYQQQRGPASSEALTAMGQLAFVLYNSDRHPEAEKILRNALELARPQHSEESEIVLDLRMHLTRALYYQFRPEDALAEAQRVYAIRSRILPPNHPKAIDAAADYVSTLTFAGRFSEAEPILFKLIDNAKADPDNGLQRLCGEYMRLGYFYINQKKFAEATDAFRLCVEARTKFHGPDHVNVAYAEFRLAKLLEQQGASTEAERLCRESLAVDESARPGSIRLIEQYLMLARLERRNGNHAAASGYIQKARVIANDSLATQGPPNFEAMNDYIAGLDTVGEYSEICDFADRAIDALSKHTSEDDRRLGALRRVKAEFKDRAATQPTPASTTPG